MVDEKKGLKELTELVDGLEVLAEFVGGVWADKKVSLEDLDDLVGLGLKLDVLKDAFEGLKELPDEVKDLDKAELLSVIGQVWSVGEAYERGRKGE